MIEQKNRDTWNGMTAKGDAVIYFAAPDEHQLNVGQYYINCKGAVSEQQLRGYRMLKLREGKKVTPQLSDELKHGLFVVFGADTSPQEAIASLKWLAKQIKNDGLLVGRSEDEDIIENCSGELRID